MKQVIIAALLMTGAAAHAQTAFDGDTPVEKIAANPDSKAVLDRDIPGLLSDAQYPLFKGMSLNQLQEASNGELTTDTVEKAVADLKALPATAQAQTAASPAAPATAPAPAPAPASAPNAPATTTGAAATP